MREWNLVKVMTCEEQMEEVTYTAGQTIYMVGEPSDKVFVVKHGRI